MRRFVISAIVDERNLFDLMKHLEDIRAGEIMARPHIVEDDPVRKKVTNGARPAGTGGQGMAKAAILAALAKDGEFAILDLKKEFGKYAVTNATYAMQRKGIVKRIAKGKYTKGRNFEKGTA